MPRESTNRDIPEATSVDVGSLEFGVWQPLVDRFLPRYEKDDDYLQKVTGNVDWVNERNSNGQKFKITAEQTRKLCVSLSEGTSLSVALRYARIDAINFRNWMKRGGSPRYKTDVEPSQADEPYETFALLVDVADGESEVDALSRLKLSRDWRAHAWFLEKRHASTWGTPDRPRGGVTIAGQVSEGQAQVVILIPDNGRGGDGMAVGQGQGVSNAPRLPTVSEMNREFQYNALEDSDNGSDEDDW